MLWPFTCPPSNPPPHPLPQHKMVKICHWSNLFFSIICVCIFDNLNSVGLIHLKKFAQIFQMLISPKDNNLTICFSVQILQIQLQFLMPTVLVK